MIRDCWVSSHLPTLKCRTERGSAPLHAPCRDVRLESAGSCPQPHGIRPRRAGGASPPCARLAFSVSPGPRWGRNSRRRGPAALCTPHAGNARLRTVCGASHTHEISRRLAVGAHGDAPGILRFSAVHLGRISVSIHQLPSPPAPVPSCSGKHRLANTYPA